MADHACLTGRYLHFGARPLLTDVAEPQTVTNRQRVLNVTLEQGFGHGDKDGLTRLTRPTNETWAACIGLWRVNQ